MYELRRNFRLLQNPSMVPTPSAAAFVGPGDVIATAALTAYGLRAYKASVIGNNLIELRRDSDNTTQTFTSQANGGLDLTAISTFKGAANLFVRTLYNQMGVSADDLIQLTNSAQPPFVLNAIGSLPAIAGAAGCFMETDTAGEWLGAGNFYADWTSSCVANRADTADWYGIWGDTSTFCTNIFDLAPNAPTVEAGDVLHSSVTGTGWFSIQSFGKNSTATHKLNVNGTTDSATGLAGGVRRLGDNVGQLGILGRVSALTTKSLSGYLTELVFWGDTGGVDVVGDTGRANLVTNQRAYWGF